MLLKIERLLCTPSHFSMHRINMYVMYTAMIPAGCDELKVNTIQENWWFLVMTAKYCFKSKPHVVCIYMCKNCGFILATSGYSTRLILYSKAVNLLPLILLILPFRGLLWLSHKFLVSNRGAWHFLHLSSANGGTRWSLVLQQVMADQVVMKEWTLAQDAESHALKYWARANVSSRLCGGQEGKQNEWIQL